MLVCVISSPITKINAKIDENTFIIIDSLLVKEDNLFLFMKYKTDKNIVAVINVSV